jgi:DinB superfamily
MPRSYRRDELGREIGYYLDHRPEWAGRNVVGFWYVTYHTLFFLDLQLSGTVEGHSPGAIRFAGARRKDYFRSYTKDELRRYLQHCREKSRPTIATLTQEKSCRICRWGSVDLSFAELLLHTMRHVQHHAAQLNLLLRQNTGSAPRWVKQTPTTTSPRQ